jgi:membrane protease YdiL (CAAX protease family)
LTPSVKLSVLAYLAYLGAALVIAAALQPEQEDVTRDLGFGEGNFGSVAAGLLIIAVAPISEEIFFRGFLFGGFRRGAPFAAAAVASAGIWGLFHYTGPDSWGVVVQLTAFGLALAWLYERTGSLWPPIALHVLNNALAFAVLTS